MSCVVHCLSMIFIFYAGSDGFFSFVPCPLNEDVLVVKLIIIIIICQNTILIKSEHLLIIIRLLCSVECDQDKKNNI